MGHIEHKQHAKEGVKCAVLTVSDSRTKENDDSGRLIMRSLEESNHKVLFYDILIDDRGVLEKTVSELISNPDVEAIITNGGTGVSKRDITIEVVSGFIEKELVGFGELFRFLSYREIGSSAIMSRALAGVCNGKIIISLPGSMNAVKLGMEEIINPELGHMVWEVNR
ncbi:MAG: molybdenum cofactor biosynthesis protein B [Candidatus Altiarchaeota archaeon]|nr:molybdenum cofactor biosynthesis protein B [Candidatus Altiarchaeota archaeon]